MNVRVLTGRHVLMWLLGSFAAVGAVNAAMVYFALKTNGGEIEPLTYLSGVHFNDTLDRVAAQRALGWQVNADLRPTADTVEITVSYRDAANQPLAVMEVDAAFVRPTHDGLDFTIPLKVAGDGKYVGTATVPQPGLWQVRLIARQGTEIRHRLDYRVVVQ
jgi:nitrogen fixation protein FixH